MTETIWGKDQMAFYRDGSFSENAGNRVADGVVNNSTTPSTIYVFGYKGQEKAVGSIVGKQGVTYESIVIDNNSRKNLGTVREFTGSCQDLTLIVDSIINKVKELNEFSFDKEAIESMVYSASRDSVNGIIAPNAHPYIPLYSENVDAVINGGIEKQLSYLLAHGFSPECIYDQAAIRSYGSSACK